MSYEKLLESSAQRTGLTEADVAAVLRAVQHILHEGLEKGEAIPIIGLEVFENLGGV